MDSSARSFMRGQSEKVTAGIRVNVESMYLRRHSKPEHGHYIFIYVVKITNESQDTVQLIDRHWVITDGYGRSDEVKGPGVIGETPRLMPGQSHTYHSFCPLSTPFGTMGGHYGMVNHEGVRFHVEVGLFNLIVPEEVN